MCDLKKKILVICGPTASGKTAFAVNIAKRLGGEIISADCMLVYKCLNIGTAKPTKEEMGGISHHMIDIAEASEKYSVSDYENEARPLCENLFNRNKIPIICGGTGFYIESVLFLRGNGHVGADPKLREEYERIEKTYGREYLFELLEKVDPESAAKLHFNDVKRVIRALEIFRLTGVKKSEQNDGFVPLNPYLAVAFDYPREELYSRINQRVDLMIQAGLVDEVSALLKSGVSEKSQSMQGIGYKEVVRFLNNEISHSTMCELIKKNTRNYAKRQITFFKKLPGLVWLNPNEKNNIEKVLELYNGD